jgi:bifunctional DNA-binding transcriptional regulator/antitoxin component of YhaV-PrlF toxin-antitoxin module
MRDVVQDLMEAFRLHRVQDVAKLFAVRPTAVSMWRRRGLPARHRLEAMRLAQERGVELPESVAGSRAQPPDRTASRSKESASVVVDRARGSAARGDWVQLDEKGRLALPPAALEVLGVEPGDKVLLEIEGNDLRVRSLRAAVAEMQAFVRRFVPEDVSLVDELIAERRREAERE